MNLVKFNHEIVQVIGREKNSFTILTREREVKKITANEINSVSFYDIKKTINNIIKKKIVDLSEYRNLKNHRCQDTSR